MRVRTRAESRPWAEPQALPARMAVAARASGVLGLLLVSAMFGVLGERPSHDLGPHPERRSQVGPRAAEPGRPPAKDQRERARAGALPLGTLYTAAVVAFVLYKCLQGKDDAAVLQEEKSKKKALQSEQQLAQLTQQLAQTEQHLNNLMTQLDPLFERVTTLVGTQRELLNTKLQTIHQLLQDCKPDKGIEVPEPEASIPFPEDWRKEEEQETDNSQAWEEPINWSPETWNLAPSWEAEQGLRRRWGRAVTEHPSSEGGTLAEGLVKQSLFLYRMVLCAFPLPAGQTHTHTRCLSTKWAS